MYKRQIFSGPSGVGKSTIINLLRSKIDFYFSISHTTRPMRDDEKDKEDYYFISEDAFKEMVSNEEFIEYERYGSFFYGTSKNEITKSDFTILDTDDQLKVIKEVIKILNIDEKRFPPRYFLSQIENTNNTIIIRSFTGSEVSAIAVTEDRSHVLIGDMGGNILWTSIWDEEKK